MFKEFAPNLHERKNSKDLSFPSELNSTKSTVWSPVSTGSTAHPEALAASHWTGSCCAGELRSSDWPTSGPRGDRTGGDPAWGSGREGTLLVRGKDELQIQKEIKKDPIVWIYKGK